MASSHREEGEFVEEGGRNVEMNYGTGHGVRGQGEQGHGQQSVMMNYTNSSQVGGGESPVKARSYKEMLEVLKHLNRACDSMTDRICGLNLKYADVITKSALLIDPEVAKILYGDEENYPDVLSTSQQSEKISPEELDKKYGNLSTGVDQHLQQRQENNTTSTEMEDDSHYPVVSNPIFQD